MIPKTKKQYITRVTRQSELDHFQLSYGSIAHIIQVVGPIALPFIKVVLVENKFSRVVLPAGFVTMNSRLNQYDPGLTELELANYLYDRETRRDG